MNYTLICLALASCLVVETAHPAMIHNYEMHVEAGGQSSVASFSYEAPDQEGRHLGMKFLSFDFAWNGIEYDESDVYWGEVWTWADGTLRDDWNTSYFGNSCGPGRCNVTAFQDEFMFQIAYHEWAHHRNFSFGFAGNALGSISGTYELVYTGVGIDPCDNLGPHVYGCVGVEATSVPEPGTVGLLLAGIAALGLKRRIAGEHGE